MKREIKSVLLVLIFMSIIAVSAFTIYSIKESFTGKIVESGTCDGTAVSCTTYKSEDNCYSQQGCYWLQLGGFNVCAGEENLCPSFSDSNGCNQQNGCSWKQTETIPSTTQGAGIPQQVAPISQGQGIFGESVNPQINSLEGSLPVSEAEIEGYLVELDTEPIVKKDIETKNRLDRIEGRIVSYNLAVNSGSVILRPYYRWQLNSQREERSRTIENHLREVENLRNQVREEHERFLELTRNIVDINSPQYKKKEFNYIFNGFVLDISEIDANRIRGLNNVKEVYPNYKVKTFLDSSVPAMEFNTARSYSGLNGQGITIAVIDTGIDSSHESLDDLDDDPNTNDPKIIGWKDFVNFNPNPYDDHGHGTHVSGIAAGTGGSSNFVGVAPGANLVGVKVLNGYGSGTFSDVIAGIEWVVQHKDEYGISIISMSLGANVNSDGTTPVEIAADYAVDMGINFVVAAGNSGAWGYNSVGIPASAFDVITVGAVDDNLDIAYFSSRGPTKDGRTKPEVSAVGVDVTSSFPGGYVAWSGTSMATPHVSGFVALLLQQNPSLTPMQVRDLLMQTAVDKGIEGVDNDYGSGVVNGFETFLSFNPLTNEIGIVKLDMKNYFMLNENNQIKTIVKNYGLNDETNVELKLLVDGNEIDRQIVSLLSKETKEIVFDYTESVLGIHNIKIQVIAVPGETFLENNEKNKEVIAKDASGIVKAVVLDSWGNYQPSYTLFDELNNNWINYGDYVINIDYDTLKKEDITYEEIAATGADVLIISNAWANGNGGMYLEFTDSEIQAIKQYVEEGHGLVGTSGTLSEYVVNNIKLAELFGLNNKIGLWNDFEAWDALYNKKLNVLVEDKLLTKNLPNEYNPFPLSIVNLEINKISGAVKVAGVDDREDVFVSAYKPGLGASVYFTTIPEYSRSPDLDKQFFYNSLTWAKKNVGSLAKDVSIYDLQVPKKSMPGEEISISAIVNNGPSAESSVNVNLFIDGNLIETKTVTFNPGEKETRIFFSYIPQEIKSYDILLESIPLIDETYLINNKVKSKLFVPEALLSGNNAEQLEDVDGNGKYDYLNISIGVNVFEQGNYILSFVLESYLGAELYYSEEYRELNVNDDKVNILVPLYLIKKFELSGQYRIKNINLVGFKDASRDILDSNSEGFVTGAYDYRTFRDSSTIILDSFNDYGLDEDGNGLYDYLVINFNADIQTAGNYEVHGWGDFLASESQSVSISEPGIREFSFKFSGLRIRQLMVNGPYNLYSVEIFQPDFKEIISAEVNYVTNPYSYEQFESELVTSSPVIISTPVTSVNEGQTYIYDVDATDADGDILAYSLKTNLEWLSIDSRTGLIKGMAPSVSEDTVYNVIVEVIDNLYEVDHVFDVTVLDIPPSEIPPESLGTQKTCETILSDCGGRIWCRLKWEILKKQTTTECSLNPTCPSGTREIKTESCTLPP